jgi:hypothetical protein
MVRAVAAKREGTACISALTGEVGAVPEALVRSVCSEVKGSPWTLDTFLG